MNTWEWKPTRISQVNEINREEVKRHNGRGKRMKN